jgi:hypothetical protein
MDANLRAENEARRQVTPTSSRRSRERRSRGFSSPKNRYFFRVFPVFVRNVARMKSAYELAMERLAKSDPSGSVALTPEQKTRLAEIDRVYKGKLAEREIFLKKQLDEAFAAQKFDDAEKIKQQLSSERARIEEEREAEKEQVRRAK